MPPLVGDEEVRESKWLKILTPNKLLTRLPILLAPMKDGNNLYKIENRIRWILYLCSSIMKPPKKIYKIQSSR